MIKLGPNKFLLERSSELAQVRGTGRIFLDVEGRRRGEELNEHGNDPYNGDTACLWSICWTDGPAYAIPVRMRSATESLRNLEVQHVRDWLRDTLSNATSWANHNVKFDAHFAWVEAGAELPPDAAWECTLTQAKIYSSDLMSYGLKELSGKWLGFDTTQLDRVRAYLDGYHLPRNMKANDYALVPVDLLGSYGCDDTLMNRELFHYMEGKLHSPDWQDLLPTWNMEKALTPCLFDMEREGLRVNSKATRVARAMAMHLQIKLATEISELVGDGFSNSPAFMYSLFIGKWGLPVLARTKPDKDGKGGGNPSFDKDALKMYLSHPEVTVDPVKLDVVRKIQAFKKEQTFCSLFANVLEEKADRRSRVHPMYNQVVRTGRMSCKEPNAQQFDVRAKQLIFTDTPDHVFLDCDASQVEFRFIVHYLQNMDAVTAYNLDPRTDFHTWVAELCGIPRKPAKNVNFAHGFGAGMKKVISMLQGEETIIAEANAMIEDRIARGLLDPINRLQAFRQFTKRRGMEVYQTYHAKLPELKIMSKYAEERAKERGYIRNLYGRRRNLPSNRAHIAFNTAVQGSAMDLIKRRIIETAPRNWPELKTSGITQRANVHDSVVFHGLRDAVDEFRPAILEKLEAVESKLSVPIRWDSDICEVTWKENTMLDKIGAA